MIAGIAAAAGTIIVAILGWAGGRHLTAAQARKANAESESATAQAAQAISQAAQAIVDPLVEQHRKAHGRIEGLEQRLQDHIDADIAKQERQDEINREHAAWDASVSQALRGAGIDVPPPPPLG